MACSFTNGAKHVPRQSPPEITPEFPHPPLPCHPHLAPAAGWNTNVLDQAGEMPLGMWRNARHQTGGGVDQRGSVGGSGVSQWKTQVQSATGTSSGSVPAVGQDAGPDSEPGLWRIFAPLPGSKCVPETTPATSSAAPKSGAGSPGATPGTPRVGFPPQAGQAKWPLPVGCGHHPARFGPCACCATPCMSRSNGFI